MSYRFNPFTGQLDIVGAGGGGTSVPNFSYDYISPTESIEVPAGQEMLLASDLVVDGELILTGQVIFLSLEPDSICPLNPVPANRKLSIFASEQCLIYDELTVDGEVYNDGEIILLPA